MSRAYWWPGMTVATRAFTDACKLCDTTKTPRTKPAGFLKPLPLPLAPWRDISVDYITPLPACEYDRLHFVRLDLPAAPFPMFFGVAYLVPLGTRRHAENAGLLSELEERVEQYRGLGLVSVMGDFNIHIAEYPSTVLGQRVFDPGRDSGPAVDVDAGDSVLPRWSVDTSVVSDSGDAPAEAAGILREFFASRR